MHIFNAFKEIRLICWMGFSKCGNYVILIIRAFVLLLMNLLFMYSNTVQRFCPVLNL